MSLKDRDVTKYSSIETPTSFFRVEDAGSRALRTVFIRVPYCYDVTSEKAMYLYSLP
jgi:hypothetical protein